MTARTLVDGDAAELTAAMFAARFPGVLAWFGTHTHHWWAIVSVAGRPRLLEAIDPRDLERALRDAQTAALVRMAVEGERRS